MAVFQTHPYPKAVGGGVSPRAVVADPRPRGLTVGFRVLRLQTRVSER